VTVSAASLNVLKGLIARGAASLATIDTWEAKRTVTPAEAETARAYWHELYDPPPAPEPEASADEPAAEAPAAADETVDDSSRG
jgi:hypothetical protein